MGPASLYHQYKSLWALKIIHLRIFSLATYEAVNIPICAKKELSEYLMFLPHALALVTTNPFTHSPSSAFRFFLCVLAVPPQSLLVALLTSIPMCYNCKKIFSPKLLYFFTKENMHLPYFALDSTLDLLWEDLFYYGAWAGAPHYCPYKFSHSIFYMECSVSPHWTAIGL